MQESNIQDVRGPFPLLFYRSRRLWGGQRPEDGDLIKVSLIAEGKSQITDLTYCFHISNTLHTAIIKPVMKKSTAELSKAELSKKVSCHFKYVDKTMILKKD